MKMDQLDTYTDFDDTDYATEAPLPTPGGTPYRTPHMSRHPSRGPTPSPSPSPYPVSSSPPTAHGRDSPPINRRMSVTHRHGHDGAFDESVSNSILDPRRFTPTLVAEILSLRREVESRANMIETLEQDLAQVRSENETATASAATAQKEARDAKRQLARAEKDDAVSAVAQERDEAVESLNELKKQLERVTKSRRQAEDDLRRIKTIQERDSENFEVARRALEHRAHVAEGRLKAVLDEVSAAGPSNSRPVSLHQRSLSEDQSRYDSGSDTASIRTMSIHGRPSSLMIGDEKLGVLLGGDPNASGLSLADELDFDAESESEDIVEGSFHLDNSDVEDTPGEMVSDAESVEDIDELPEVVDMGIQVVPAINYDEQIHDLEELLLQKTSDLERTYEILDKKTVDLESAYIELDRSKTKVSQLQEQISVLDNETSEKYQVFDEQRTAFERKVSDFEEREQEVEDRWAMLDEKSIWLGERETAFEQRSVSLDERENGQDSRDITLDSRMASLDEQCVLLDERERSLSEKEYALSEETARIAVLIESTEKKAEITTSDFDGKPKEGEYEANARRKRSAGTSSPTPPLTNTRPQTPLYVSVDVQTDIVEATMEPPSPPKTPTLEEIKVVMQSTGIQTDPVKQVPPPVIHVPGIMVTPPEPTPPLPPPPKPVMKDVSVQTKPMRTRTHSMQTEEIKLDERLKKFAPHLLPSALLPKVDKDKDFSKSTIESDRVPPNVPRRSSKRTMKRSSIAPIPAPTSVPSSSRGMVDAGAGTAVIYSSPKGDENADARSTPESSRRDGLARNLFNGVDLSQEYPHSSGDDDFPDEAEISVDEFKTALSAPRPRKQKNLTLNLGYPSPVPEFERLDGPRRQPSMRKGAMVTAGVHAHARARSPSLHSNRTTESGGTISKIGPPFPVPMRHSSRRPGYTSDRELAHSPTPRFRGSARGHGRRQSIRKVRSAAALPSTRDSMNRSPPPLSASTVGPDSPELPPPLPRDEIYSSGFDRSRFGQSRHKHQTSTNTATTGQASVGSSVQQTSVVDAIAQTMVGEWMWKYVRRRRSFGVTDTPQVDDASGGQRHKRWVWLAPYERAVMWSSRQPTSGNALLGKSGRKRKRSILHPFGGNPDAVSDMMDRVLTKKVLIQSVLDVKDDTPLPKGANVTPVFNRSILILTPARALKFTAPSRERHYVWLTALSFLSHSPEGNDGMLALPPPMPFEYEQMQQQVQDQPPPAPLPPLPPIPARTNAFSNTRDSVRLAKGKSRANSGANGTLAVRNPSIDSRESFSAEPPSIPRFPGYSRRRSSSGVRPQTRSTSHGYERSMASYATTSNAGSVNGDSLYGGGGFGLASANSSISHGVSGHGAQTAGWEAGPMGTVRMEAFVERKPRYEFDEEDELDSRVSSYRLRRDKRMSRSESYWNSGGEFYNGDDDEFFRADDPFRGF